MIDYLVGKWRNLEYGPRLYGVWVGAQELVIVLPPLSPATVNLIQGRVCAKFVVGDIPQAIS